MTIVTGCEGPDLDGIACMFAYSELLNKLGVPSEVRYSGQLDLETEYLKKYTNYFPASRDPYPYNSDFVLVDTANPDIIDQKIPVDKVITIFDHRQLVFTSKFVNAELKIDLVGSCATLICEEFLKHNLEPSKNVATYLYAAIIFSTIYFKNSVTTDRDINMASWLLSIVNLDKNFIYDLFSVKSNITPENLYNTIVQDFSIKILSGRKLGVAQIEMTNINRFLDDLNLSLKSTLLKIKNDNNLDYIFFNGIDLLEGYSLFVVIDTESSSLFSKALNISTFGESFKYHSIIMRKQIWPKVEEYLSHQD